MTIAHQLRLWALFLSSFQHWRRRMDQGRTGWRNGNRPGLQVWCPFGESFVTFVLQHFFLLIPPIFSVHLLIFSASASLALQCQWFWCHGSQTRSASLPIRSDKDKNNTRQPDNQKRQHKTIKQPQLHTSPSLENHSIWFLVLCSWLSQITRHSRPLTIVSPAFFHWICRLHLGGDQRIHEHCQQRQQQQQQQEQQ